MANPAHLAKLKEGVAAWHRWRRENPLTNLDLSGAYLVRADLSDVNLSKADLRGVNLIDANLGRADLRVADVRGANLIRADLSEANLSGANLSEADLSGAKVGWTTFANVNLSNVKGLTTVIHLGPSSIGIDTLYQSGVGNIPEEFLRGAGIPQDFIDYLPPSLRGYPIQFYSCFISYSSKDDEFARRLHADLQAHKVRVWFAPEDLKIGDRTRRVIHDTIRLYDKLLVVLTGNSVESDWVEEEVETALQKERRGPSTVLFPVRLDDAVMNTNKAWAETVRDRNIGDFRRWKDHDSYTQAFDRLLKDLQAEGKPAG